MTMCGRCSSQFQANVASAAHLWPVDGSATPAMLEASPIIDRDETKIWLREIASLREQGLMEDASAAIILESLNDALDIAENCRRGKYYCPLPPLDDD